MQIYILLNRIEFPPRGGPIERTLGAYTLPLRCDRCGPSRGVFDNNG